MAPLLFFIVMILSVVIGSLIPSLIVKLLMGGVFKRQVYFAMVLLATVLSTIFTIAIFIGLMWYSQGSLNVQSLENLEGEMTLAETALSWLFGFMLQLVLLTLMVPDENMELISAWKWAVVLILQYVVIILIVFALAFVFASIGMAAETSQILTKVV